MSKEDIYDEEISPLMKQIIKLCRKHGIAMVVSFAIPTEEDPGLRCTTSLPDESGAYPFDLLEALQTLYPEKRSA